MEYIIAVLIPVPGNLAKKIDRTEKKMGFTYNQKSPAHITLYLARYPKRNFEKLVEDLRQADLPSFPILPEAPTVVNNKLEGNKFVFIKLKKHDKIYDVHKKVLKIGNTHRAGLIRTKEAKRIKAGLYSKKELDYLNRYGYTRVLSLFNPHISIGKTETKDLKTLRAELKKNLDIRSSDKFIVKKLIVGIYERDLRGIYKKGIREEKIRLK